MKLILQLFLCMACGSQPKAQHHDIEQVIAAHDLLFFTRTGTDTEEKVNVSRGFYENHSKVDLMNLLHRCDSILAEITNIKRLRRVYPFASSGLQLEYYGLQLLVELDEAKPSDYPRLKKIADMLDQSYAVQLGQKEVNRLAKAVSIGYLNLIGSKLRFYRYLMNPVNGMMAKLTQLKLKYQAELHGHRQSDELALLNLHDYLFSQRLHSYPVKAALLERLHVAQKELATIADTAVVRKHFAPIYNATFFEVSLLAFQASEINKDSLSNSQRLSEIRKIFSFIRENSSTEITALKQLAGAGRFTILHDKRDSTYEKLLIRYNGILLDLLSQEILIQAKRQQQEFAPIDSLFGLTKNPHSLVKDSITRAVATRNFIEIRRRYSSGKGEFFLKQNNYDSAWHFLVLAELLESSKTEEPQTVFSKISHYKQQVATYLKSKGASVDSSKTNFSYEIYPNLWDNSDLSSVIVVGYNSIVRRFPRNPPKASCRADRLKFKAPVKTLYQANDLLSNALKQAGYAQLDYFELDGGFAIVAPFEQLEGNGNPKPDPPRFVEKVSLRENFSFTNYFKALFGGLTGYYRVLIFLVTDELVASANPQKDLRLSSFEGGFNGLPEDIDATDEFTDKHACTVLVYEFEKLQKNDPVKFILSSRIKAKQHLESVKLSALFK